jgi:hypothetical protein
MMLTRKQKRRRQQRHKEILDKYDARMKQLKSDLEDAKSRKERATYAVLICTPANCEDFALLIKRSRDIQRPKLVKLLDLTRQKRQMEDQIQACLDAMEHAFISTAKKMEIAIKLKKSAL